MQKWFWEKDIGKPKQFTKLLRGSARLLATCLLTKIIMVPAKGTSSAKVCEEHKDLNVLEGAASRSNF